MAAISLSGAKTAAFKATRGTAVVGNGILALTANTFYEISAVATTGSTLPIGAVSAIFKSPDTSSTALKPAIGDIVYPLTLERICKTDAEVSLEEGTIDVTDDCENGFNASILDGYRSISGSLNGFLKFDEVTGVLLDGTKDLFGRFFNMVEDNGLGVYTVKPAENERLLLFILLNNNVKVGDTQNFIIVPALLNSMGTGAGLKDAQKRDIAWTKAQGYCSLYQRKVFAADII
jgi:hypothetical protein